jgi:hypothetical protein
MPGVFDPQYFEIDYKGKKYYQMHIDGGMNSYVFMIGMYEDWHKVLNLPKDINLDVSLYILANRQYRYKKQNRALESDSAISILTAVAKNTVDLVYDRSIYRLYKASQERGYHFYYTGIDDNITLEYMPHQFEPKEMKRLFNEGYKKGINTINWQTSIADDEVLRHY